MIWTCQYRAHLPPRENNVAPSSLAKLRPYVDLSKIFSVYATGDVLIGYNTIPCGFLFEYIIAPFIKEEDNYLPFLRMLDEEDFKIPPLKNKIWTIRPISFYSSGWFIKGVHKLPSFKGMDVGWSSVPPKHEGKPWWGEYYDPALKPYYNPPPESAFAEDSRSYVYTGNLRDPRVVTPSLIPDYCFNNLRYFFRFFDTVYILKPTEYAKRRYYRLVEEELPAIMRILQGLSWLQKVPIPDDLKQVPTTKSGAFLNISLGEAYFLAYRILEKEEIKGDIETFYPEGMIKEEKGKITFFTPEDWILPTPHFYPPALQSRRQRNHLNSGIWKYSPNSGFPGITHSTWWDVENFEVKDVGLSLLGFINALPSSDWDADNAWWHKVREEGIQNHVFASYSTGYYDSQGNWIMPPFVEIDTPLLIWSSTTGNFIIYNPEVEEVPAENITKTFMWGVEEYTGKIGDYLEYKLKIALNTVVRLSFISFKKFKENAHIYAPPDPKEIQKAVTPWFEVEEVYTFPFTQYLESKKRKAQFKPRDYARHVDYLQPPEEIATSGGIELIKDIIFRYATLPTGESTNVGAWSLDENKSLPTDHLTDNLSVKLPENDAGENRKWLEKYLKPAFVWATKKIREHFVNHKFIHSKMIKNDVTCWQLRTIEGAPNPNLPITFTTEKEIVRLKEYAEKVGFMLQGDPPKGVSVQRKVWGFIPVGYFYLYPGEDDLKPYLLWENMRKYPLTYAPTSVMWVGGTVAPPELQLIPAYQVLEHPRIALCWDLIGKTYSLRKEKTAKWGYLTGEGEDKKDYWANLLSQIILRPLTQTEFALFEYNQLYETYTMKYYWQPVVLGMFNDIEFLHNLIEVYTQDTSIALGRAGEYSTHTIHAAMHSYKTPAGLTYWKVSKAAFNAASTYPPTSWIDLDTWVNFLSAFAAELLQEGLPGNYPHLTFEHLGTSSLPVETLSFFDIIGGLKYVFPKEKHRLITYLTVTTPPIIAPVNYPIIINPLSTGLLSWHMEGFKLSIGSVHRRWLRGYTPAYTETLEITASPAMDIGNLLWWRSMLRVDLNKDWKAYIDFRGVGGELKKRGTILCSAFSLVPIIPPTISEVPLSAQYRFDKSFYLWVERIQEGEHTLIGSGGIGQTQPPKARFYMQPSHMIYTQSVGDNAELQLHLPIYPHLIQDTTKLLNFSDYMLQGVPLWLLRCESIPPEGSLLSIGKTLDVKYPHTLLPEYELTFFFLDKKAIRVKCRWLVESLTVPKKLKSDIGAVLRYPDETEYLLWHPNVKNPAYWENVYLSGDGFRIGYFERRDDGKLVPTSDGGITRDYFPHMSVYAPEEIWVASGVKDDPELGKLTVHTFRADHPFHVRVYLSIFVPQRAGYNTALLKEGYQTTFAAYWQEGDYIFTLLRAACTEDGITKLQQKFNAENVFELAHVLYGFNRDLGEVGLPALRAFHTLQQIQKTLDALKRILEHLPYSQKDPDYAKMLEQEAMDEETVKRFYFMLQFTKAIENPVYNPFALYYAPLDFSDEEALGLWEGGKPLDYTKRTACCLLIMPKCPTLAAHAKIDASLFLKGIEPIDIITLVSQRLMHWRDECNLPLTRMDIPIIFLFRELYAHALKAEERRISEEAGADEDYLASVFPLIEPFIFRHPRWVYQWMKNHPDYQALANELDIVSSFKVVASELTCNTFYYPHIPHYIEFMVGLTNTLTLALRRWERLYNQRFIPPQQQQPVIPFLNLTPENPELAKLFFGLDGDLSYFITPSQEKQVEEIDLRDTGIVGWLHNGGILQTLCVPTPFTPVSHLITSSFVYMPTLAQRLHRLTMQASPSRDTEKWRMKVNPITYINVKSALGVVPDDESPVQTNEVELTLTTTADCLAVPILSVPVNILNPILKLKAEHNIPSPHRVWKQVPEIPGLFISQAFVEQLDNKDVALVMFPGVYLQPYCYPEQKPLGYTKLFRWHWETGNGGTLFWIYHIPSYYTQTEMLRLLPSTVAPYYFKLRKYLATPPKWWDDPLSNHVVSEVFKATPLINSLGQLLFRLPEILPPLTFIVSREETLIRGVVRFAPVFQPARYPLWEFLCLLHLLPIDTYPFE